MKVQKLNKRQARQVLYLSRFDFTLKYVLETKIEKADRLSRRPDQKVEIEKNNNNQIFIKNHWLHNLSKVVIEGPEVEILEKIKIAKSKNKEVVRVVEEIKKVEVKVLREKEWQIKKDLMLKKGKVCVPKDEVLRVEIIWLYHDTSVTRYKRKWKTIELVIINYWWPRVTRDMGKYIEDCDMC